VQPPPHRKRAVRPRARLVHRLGGRPRSAAFERATAGTIFLGRGRRALAGAAGAPFWRARAPAVQSYEGQRLQELSTCGSSPPPPATWWRRCGPRFREDQYHRLGCEGDLAALRARPRGRAAAGRQDPRVDGARRGWGRGRCSSCRATSGRATCASCATGSDGARLAGRPRGQVRRSSQALQSLHAQSDLAHQRSAVQEAKERQVRSFRALITCARSVRCGGKTPRRRGTRHRRVYLPWLLKKHGIVASEPAPRPTQARTTRHQSFAAR
jgi:hypothetical protein